MNLPTFVTTHTMLPSRQHKIAYVVVYAYNAEVGVKPTVTDHQLIRGTD